jgi:glutamyl-tRNA synthetase
MSQQLADLLFPEVTLTIEDIRKQYPARPAGVSVTRFAPSPTGFLHIGGVYTAYVASKFVHQWWKNGINILRIEDTDQKRQKDGTIDLIIDWLETFGIHFDEWPLWTDYADKGNYGPYIQSHRKHIYHVFVKHAVAQWFAYPCWMDETEIEAVRNMQQAAKKIPGIYRQYSKWREASLEAQQEMITTGKPFVIRLKSPAILWDKVTVSDIIKGDVITQDNFIDMVLLKSTDGLPTYHMAHLVDDYLMWTTHVIRADEWFASMPLHVQLFRLFGFQAPLYAHISPLLKLDPATWNKRKLSKRHDAEADIQYFFQQGIPVGAIMEFLTNIIDPLFEEWQKNNPDKTYEDYIVDITRMNPAGALLDMTKLLFVSKEWLARLGKEEFMAKALEWVEKYGKDVLKEQYEGWLVSLMKKYPEYSFHILNIERLTEADPKRYRMFSDIVDQLPCFYDEIREKASAVPSIQFPEVCTADRMTWFLHEYASALDLSMSKQDWFNQLKEIGARHGFAASNGDFKAWWYVWKIGDLAMYLRIALLCSTTTPDLYESMKVMGKERVLKRLLAD